MGHKIIHLRNRVILLAVMASALIGLLSLTGYLLTGSFYYRVFHYTPTNEHPISVNVPTVHVNPNELDSNTQAHGIPVIFYHGVLEDAAADINNTTRSKFLSQMVALKENGYYTITAQDLADFYSGKKKFYGKPIMITFDDGRVDSYVPTNDVLKKLGFQAVFFIVTGKQDNHIDPFFLSWNQLEVANKSGLWDLEAHGWYSHTKIAIDAKGDKSNPLTNRMWLPQLNRLETPQEATKRITNDYVQNIKDMQAHFPGHNIVAFAVPYGDYGQKENNFLNFPSAKTVNYDICKRYYKLCMDIDNQGYNFQQHDPYATERIQVPSDWWGSDLIASLNANRPTSPNFNVDLTKAKSSVPTHIHLLGNQTQSITGLSLSSKDPGQGYINYILGNANSFNYSISATYKMNVGTSVYLSGYKFDDGFHSQDVLFGTTGNVAYLNLVKDGVTSAIATQVLTGFDSFQSHTLRLDLYADKATCYIDGEQVFSTNIPVIEPRGTYGFDNYGPAGSDVTYSSIILSPTHS